MDKPKRSVSRIVRNAMYKCPLEYSYMVTSLAILEEALMPEPTSVYWYQQIQMPKQQLQRSQWFSEILAVPSLILVLLARV